MEKPIDILLVDDEARNLDALAAILSDQGYRLLRAQDAERALRLLLDNDVAVIVLDIRMPGIGGIELAQTIKGAKRFREIPIIFLTAHLVDDQDVAAGYGVGAVDYLTKPFNPQILRHKVAVLAELFRKTRALAELNEKLEQRVRERTAELERSEAALRDAAAQKDEFLAVLAHELRNPLVPLRIGVHLLAQQEEIASQPLTSRTLASMSRQVDHLVRLIDDLMDIARISRGAVELKREDTDLATLAENAVDSFRSAFSQKNIAVDLRTVPHLSASVDPARITQILSNLLHNAWKFTPVGGSVVVQLEPQGDGAVLRVTDTGIGIRPDQIERVFEMFTRLDRASPTAVAGAGIGLALARRLARMHEGDLTASSAGEGQGTSFSLVLPHVRIEAEPADKIAPPISPQPTPSVELSIVVIEDQEDIVDLMTVWLERLGHRVAAATTGAEGIDLVLTTRPQVVLCDLGLPDMDGTEVCKRILAGAHDFHPVMIAVTGWGQDSDRKRTGEAGFHHHLVKPVSLDQLTSLFRTIGEAIARD